MLHCAAVIAAALVTAERNTASVPCDVLIILGSRVDGDTPRADLRARIDAAAEYLKKYPSCIAIGTGGNFRAEQTVSEAQAIKTGLSPTASSLRVCSLRTKPARLTKIF